MRTDFTPDNVELWISNWKRKELISDFARQWLDSFDFERVNIITNHSSVIIDDFAEDIKPRIKIWNNVMRHDYAIGPMVENYNQAYVHTFLSGKKYCITAHDNMFVKKGWDDIIKQTNYELYTAPQGDQVCLMTLDGLRTFGWWDERYATNGNHELDYLSRALRMDLGHNKASFVDYHAWHEWPEAIQIEEGDVVSPICRNGHPEFGDGFPYLRWNDVGLDKYWVRANKHEVPQTGPKKDSFSRLSWSDRKWRGEAPNTFRSFVEGPTEEEIDWYPWLNIDSLDFDICKIQ
jgi:hypothetical protein